MGFMQKIITWLQSLDNRLFLWWFYKKNTILLYLINVNSLSHIIKPFLKRNNIFYIVLQNTAVDKNTHSIFIINIADYINKSQNYVDVDLLEFESLENLKIFLMKHFRTYYLEKTTHLPKTAIVKFFCAMHTTYVRTKNFDEGLRTRHAILKRSHKTEVILIKPNIIGLELHFKKNDLFLRYDGDIQLAVNYYNCDRQEYYINDTLQAVQQNNKTIYNIHDERSFTEMSEIPEMPEIPEIQLNFN